MSRMQSQFCWKMDQDWKLEKNDRQMVLFYKEKVHIPKDHDL